MQRILAAVDLSDSTEKVLQFASDLARSENASVSVLYAMPPLRPANALASSFGMSIVAMSADEQVEFRTSIERLRQVVEATGLSDSECLCVRGNTVETIRSAAERLHADLIVTGSHCHGRLSHTMFGSVREALLPRAPCPVLVVPKYAKPS